MLQNSNSSIVDKNAVAIPLTKDLADEIVKPSMKPDMPLNAVNARANLIASTPPESTLRRELDKYVSKKRAVFEFNLSRAEANFMDDIPAFIEALADLRGVNALSYRLVFASYDELKSTWLKYIHGIL